MIGFSAPVHKVIVSQFVQSRQRGSFNRNDGVLSIKTSRLVQSGTLPTTSLLSGAVRGAAPSYSGLKALLSIAQGNALWRKGVPKTKPQRGEINVIVNL
jgi:hypothetical protein